MEEMQQRQARPVGNRALPREAWRAAQRGQAGAFHPACHPACRGQLPAAARARPPRAAVPPTPLCAAACPSLPAVPAGFVGSTRQGCLLPYRGVQVGKQVVAEQRELALKRGAARDSSGVEFHDAESPKQRQKGRQRWCKGNAAHAHLPVIARPSAAVTKWNELRLTHLGHRRLGGRQRHKRAARRVGRCARRGAGRSGRDVSAADGRVVQARRCPPAAAS